MLVIALALQAAIVASAQRVQLIHPTNAVWRYLADGSDQGASWQASAFDDSTWPQGQALFGNDTGYPYGFNTAIPGLTPINVYYRTHFTWSAGTLGVVLTGTNYVDDGSIIYLNGVEIARFNMPAGPAAFDTLAPAANPGGFPNVNAGEPVLVQLQIPLDNVLAVEVHQNSATSSDRVHGLALYGQQAVPPCTDNIQPTNRVVINRRSTTFIVVLPSNCGVPTPSIQWYRNVGLGEELIAGATGTAYTLTNALDTVDDGTYYARLTNPSGTVDSRQATLDVQPDTQAPIFLQAQVVGPGLNTFRLTTDEPLCAVAVDCGSDYTFQFNWQILQSDNLAIDLGAATITQISPTVYEFTTSNPRDPSKQYQITVTPVFGEISDLDRNFVAPGTFAETGIARSFQQNDVNGYTGTQDTELHSNATADTIQGAQVTMTIDNDDAGIAHGLLRFDNIIGGGPNQIPPGSAIVSATLTVNQNDAGSANNFHRMLVTWDQASATWNSMVNGISADDVEAMSAIDAVKPGGTVNGPIPLNVTASVQAWADGAPNYGWAIISTGTDGWDIDLSEGPQATAPLLVVEFRTVPCVGPPTITAQPPAAVAATEFQPFSITVGLDNACGTLQWTKNGADIPGANSATYSVASASPSDAGSYRLRATNPDGTVTSSAAVVTVSGDTTRPRVTRVASSANGTTITVQFNEAVSTASAQNTANYTLTPSVTVSSAVLGANNTVTLTTAPRNVGTAYSLRIAGVTDTAAVPNLIDPNPTIVALTSASIVAGAEFGSTWLYNSNNLDSTAGAWKNVGFVPDATWGTGPASFGIETSAAVLGAAPAPINTPLSANSVAPGDQLTTTYFRKDITLPALPAGARYVICHYTDDGHITYLDGAEINRYAMPAGAVTFTNRSTGIAGGEATMRSFSFTATPGPHVLAVELHQAGTTSSDTFFAMEVRIVSGAAPSMSISRAGNGDINLSWPGDANWQLRNSTTVDGLYNNTAIPAGTAQGHLTIPAAAAGTGNNFYQLHYICLP
jgi:hypothetical protein